MSCRPPLSSNSQLSITTKTLGICFSSSQRGLPPLSALKIADRTQCEVPKVRFITSQCLLAHKEMRSRCKLTFKTKVLLAIWFRIASRSIAPPNQEGVGTGQAVMSNLRKASGDLLAKMESVTSYLRIMVYQDTVDRPHLRLAKTWICTSAAIVIGIEFSHLNNRNRKA